MKTNVYDMKNGINPSLIKKSSGLLINNGVVAFPTETVYGLGANANSDKAVFEIFAIKNRPADNPLIVHVSDISHCQHVIKRDLTDIELKLANAFWPGPLSIIFENAANEDSNVNSVFGLSKLVTCGLSSCAIRVPSNPIARALIKECNLPVAAPSANLSGKPSPTCCEHVLQDLDGKINVVIDGGRCNVGLESTVVRIKEGVVQILRKGGITRERISDLIGDENVTHFESVETAPACPGLKYKHYSPDTRLFAVKGDQKMFIKSVREMIQKENNGNTKRIGVLCCEEWKDEIKKFGDLKYSENIVFSSLGPLSDPNEMSRNLYAGLRHLDQCDVKLILAQSLKSRGIELAFMDRLNKACDKTISEND